MVHDRLPQGRLMRTEQLAPLEVVLNGPSPLSDGRLNLCGALRQSMAALGYESIKDLQKAELVVTRG